ncbi:MAG: beta-ketoacyl-[acyl-carrier-protein] synthase family protein [Candidatus Zixiibacteriota bacterium]|nr:MAG: beta-ketoacyl-[acyl-carrier-protein] synthase family protein [candidate division Zixibacteria bacterium]
MPVGEIEYTNEELATLVKVTDYKKYSRTALLSLIAAQEAFCDSKTDIHDGYRTGIISATTAGGIDQTERFYHDVNSDTNFIITHSANHHVEAICEMLNINDFSATISTACSSSANAIMNGTRLIKSGRLDRVLVGGTDALSKYTVNGFNSLMILDNEVCKPFDEHRNGLNLGEGAAYLMLESEDAIKQHPEKQIYGTILGYANANDAYHQTASSPEGNGAVLSMQKALENAQIKPSEISYINVHGTGTHNNDDSEATALQTIYGDAVPPFSSTKAFTGHTLGASGAIEAIFSLWAINEGLIFPNLNFKTKMAKFNFSPNTTLKTHQDIRIVLSNSFGFGGNNTTLIIKRK